MARRRPPPPAPPAEVIFAWRERLPGVPANVLTDAIATRGEPWMHGHLPALRVQAAFLAALADSSSRAS